MTRRSPSETADAGEAATDAFVAQWDHGEDNFAENPPNASLSIVGGEKMNATVIILSDPQLSSGDLSYALDVFEGGISPSSGPVSLLIEIVGRPMTQMSVTGISRRG